MTELSPTARFGGVATILTALLAVECTASLTAGVVAGGIMAVIPAHLMRSVAGERIEPQPEVIRATMSDDSRYLLHGLRDLRRLRQRVDRGVRPRPDLLLLVRPAQPCTGHPHEGRGRGMIWYMCVCMLCVLCVCCCCCVCAVCVLCVCCVCAVCVVVCVLYICVYKCVACVYGITIVCDHQPLMV